MQEIPVEIALGWIRKNPKAKLNWNNCVVKLSGTKLRIIRKFNATCVRCKQVAIKAILVRNPQKQHKNSALLHFVTSAGTILTVDHIKPKSKGGKKHAHTNMQCMCLRCNAQKGNNE